MKNVANLDLPLPDKKLFAINYSLDVTTKSGNYKSSTSNSTSFKSYNVKPLIRVESRLAISNIALQMSYMC